MSKTLYVTDLDGTLLNSDIDISENSATIINSLIKKGLNFTCATARSYMSSKKFFDKLDLKLPVVLYNGAMLADSKTGKILDACIMDAQKLKPILDMLEQKKLLP